VDLKQTSLPDVVVIRLDEHTDDRGFLVEQYHEPRFAAAGLPTTWRQDNHSRSKAGVLRGLHFQIGRPQGKLVACLRGTVFDVAVDVRVGSPTFGRWTSVTLSENLPQLLWIPPGFAHGFCAMSEVADITYKCTDVYAPGNERGVVWNDKEIGVEWPIREPILSPRDRALPSLRDVMNELPRYSGLTTSNPR
jgi:dTDP-4-dehydrorhamnose 3,5-epimerase